MLVTGVHRVNIDLDKFRNGEKPLLILFESLAESKRIYGTLKRFCEHIDVGLWHNTPVLMVSSQGRNDCSLHTIFKMLKLVEAHQNGENSELFEERHNEMIEVGFQMDYEGSSKEHWSILARLFLQGFFSSKEMDLEHLLCGYLLEHVKIKIKYPTVAARNRETELRSQRVKNFLGKQKALKPTGAKI